MSDFVARRPIWSLIIILAVAILVWLVFSIWTPGMEASFGRKRVFLSALFNGITLGALYFLVASGFTLGQPQGVFPRLELPEAENA